MSSRKSNNNFHFKINGARIAVKADYKTADESRMKFVEVFFFFYLIHKYV